jgi:hypothetical protein
MGQKFLKPWAGIVFLLPLLVNGDLARKGQGAAEAEIHGGLQDEEEPPLRGGEPLPKWLSVITEDIASEHGISPRLVKSIIWTESQGDPRKISPKGARGLMQLMPVVAQHYKVSDPHDPATNIRAGVQYLGNLLEEFSGDLALALAAYNAGPTAVRKYRGIPPFAETQAFVKRVSELFHAAETSPPLPWRGAKFPGGEGGKAAERPMEEMSFQGSPRMLAFLLKSLNPEGQEVQVP